MHFLVKKALITKHLVSDNQLCQIDDRKTSNRKLPLRVSAKIVMISHNEYPSLMYDYFEIFGQMQEHPKGLSLLDTTIIIRYADLELLHHKLMQLLCTGSCNNIYVSMNIWKDSK